MIDVHLHQKHVRAMFIAPEVHLEPGSVVFLKPGSQEVPTSGFLWNPQAPVKCMIRAGVSQLRNLFMPHKLEMWL